MTKVFIEEDSGAEWKEVVDTIWGTKVIAPVKEEPKWTVGLFTYDQIGPLIYINIESHISEDQSDRIKEAVEALIEEIFTDDGSDAVNKTSNAVLKARNAILEGQDD